MQPHCLLRSIGHTAQSTRRMVTERVEGEKRSARYNSAMCSSAAHAREAGGGMAARCTGCWCTRTLERELPPVAERHGGSSRTAAAAVCQRAGGYGAGLGTLAPAAVALVMGAGSRDELLCHGLRAAPRSSAGTRGLRLAPLESSTYWKFYAMHVHRDAPTCHDVAFSLRGATPELTANPPCRAVRDACAP